MPESDRLDRIERQLDSLHAQLSQLAGSIAVLTERSDRVAKLEERLMKLENSKAWLLGAAFGLSALTGGATHFIAKVLDPPTQTEAKEPRH